MRFQALLMAVSLIAGPGAAAAQRRTPPAPIDVMVLGTWHFANHNLDVHNVVSEDVRSDRRQHELQLVADVLETFRPTKIVIEKIATKADLIDQDFGSFTPASLREDRSERVQIGYRVAHDLGLKHVYAVNEQPSDGEPDYFPYGKVQDYAKAHGQSPVLDALNARTAAGVENFGKQQGSSSIAELLLQINGPTYFGGIESYYGMLAIGDTEQQPGAELNAMWYLRNAKIFAKLMTVAEPGDRILIVYGAGHAYWLRHFASETPGFRNVDPRPYLSRAAAKQ